MPVLLQFCCKAVLQVTNRSGTSYPTLLEGDERQLENWVAGCAVSNGRVIVGAGSDTPQIACAAIYQDQASGQARITLPALSKFRPSGRPLRREHVLDALNAKRRSSLHGTDEDRRHGLQLPPLRCEAISVSRSQAGDDAPADVATSRAIAGSAPGGSVGPSLPYQLASQR